MRFEVENSHFELIIDEQHGSIQINNITEKGVFLDAADSLYIGKEEAIKLSKTIENLESLASQYAYKINN